MSHINSINPLDVISILESELPAADREIQLLALCEAAGEIYQLYALAASHYQENDQKQQAFDCLLLAAQRACQASRPNQALVLYMNALQLLKELPTESQRSMVKVQEAIADVAWQLGEEELATSYYTMVLQGATSTEERSMCYRKLGEIHTKRADYDRALSYFQQALTVLGEPPSPEHARSYNGIGEIYFQQAEYQPAEQHFKRALEVLSDAPDDETLTLVLKNLGNVSHLQGKLSDAMTYYEQSLSLGEKRGDISLQAKLYNNLGTCFKKRGDLKQAIESYQNSLRLKEQIDDVAGLAPLYTNLGMLYSHQKDFTQAIEYCRKGVEFAQQVGNLSRVAESYLNLGAVYALQKQFKPAVEAYQTSLRIVENSGDVRVVATIYVNLAEAYCGDENLSAAYEYYNRAREILTAVDIPEIRAQAHYVLGLIYSQQQHWQEATTVLQQAIEIFETIRYQDNVEISMQELGRAFLNQMNQKLALQQQLTPVNIVTPVGKSEAMANICATVAKLAEVETPVLILGETGVGKSLFARFIHASSARRNFPLLEIDCGALPENLLESELFGHERGAFTGALSRKLGKFELANQGTLFLDEIGNMSAALQAKLLRVLQEQKFERVGGVETQTTDVRIISATNKNLEQLVEEGQFRQDLYYRIKVISMTIPPLRERKEDLPLLIDYFLAQYSHKLGKKSCVTISDDVLELLLQHSWPGNIRELENAIQSAVIRTNSNVIYPEHLSEELRLTTDVSHQAVETIQMNEGMTLKEVEQEYILQTLIKTDYNVTQTAQILGISRRTLYNKLETYKLSRP
ncbi:MAG: sigma 54-interacting transcriptional regulator [Planctomycetota bacterium]